MITSAVNNNGRSIECVLNTNLLPGQSYFLPKNVHQSPFAKVAYQKFDNLDSVLINGPKIKLTAKSGAFFNDHDLHLLQETIKSHAQAGLKFVDREQMEVKKKELLPNELNNDGGKGAGVFGQLLEHVNKAFMYVINLPNSNIKLHNSRLEKLDDIIEIHGFNFPQRTVFAELKGSACGGCAASPDSLKDVEGSIRNANNQYSQLVQQVVPVKKEGDKVFVIADYLPLTKYKEILASRDS